MNTYLIKTLKIAGWVVGVIITLYLSVALYIQINRETITKKMEAAIDNLINGKVNIDAIDISMLTTFPNVSLNLYGITISDTLHHQPVVKAGTAAIRVNVLQLFNASPEIAKLVIADASIHIATDSSGYNNANVFNKKETSRKAPAKQVVIKKIECRNLDIAIADAIKNKLFAFNFTRLNAGIQQRDSLFDIVLTEECLVKGLGFNLAKGSYLLNQTLTASNWRITLNTATGDISFNSTPLYINKQRFNVAGAFHFKDVPSFRIGVNSTKVPYALARHILTQKQEKKLSNIDIHQPMDSLVVTISGPMAYHTEPRVNARWVVKNSAVTTPVVAFNSCSFYGVFNNQVLRGISPCDANSKILIEQLDASWGNIPVHADTLQVTDLKTPMLSFDFRSKCTFKQLDEQLALSSITLKDGSASLNLQYKGPLIPDATLLSKVTAFIAFTNGTLVYEPRHINFTNCNGSIAISANSITAEKISCDVLKNHFDITITGNEFNRMALQDSGKSYITCNVFTPRLNINDFTQALTTQKVTTTRKGIGKLAATALAIDNLLEKGDMQLNLNATEAQLEKFTAQNVEAKLLFQQDDWEVQKASLTHAGGSVLVTGKIHQVNANYHQVNAQLNLTNVDVRNVFYAFNNFGQTGITYKNLKGKMNTKASLTMGLNNKGKIVPKSMRGVVDFNIKQGALINYQPVIDIQKQFFKKRDFSTVSFADLKDRLIINGDNITINKMEINSTALTMYVEGIYSFKDSTDISIQIPLSNMARQEADEVIVNQGTDAKVGPSIFLRAKNGINGKVKVGLDVFKMFRKKKSKAAAQPR